MKSAMTLMFKAEPWLKSFSFTGANAGSLRPSRPLANLMLGLEHEPKLPVAAAAFPFPPLPLAALLSVAALFAAPLLPLLLLLLLLLLAAPDVAAAVHWLFCVSH